MEQFREGTVSSFIVVYCRFLSFIVVLNVDQFEFEIFVAENFVETTENKNV